MVKKLGAWIECDRCEGNFYEECPICYYRNGICILCGGEKVIPCRKCKKKGEVWDPLFDIEEFERINNEKKVDEDHQKALIYNIFFDMEKSDISKDSLFQSIINEIPNVPLGHHFMLFSKIENIPDGKKLLTEMLNFVNHYKIKKFTIFELKKEIVDYYGKKRTEIKDVQLQSVNIEDFYFINNWGFRDTESRVWIIEPMYTEKQPYPEGHCWYKNHAGQWICLYNGKLTQRYNIVKDFENYVLGFGIQNGGFWI